MSALPQPPTIFAPRRRLTRERRAARLQVRPGAPDWFAAALAEDLADRAGFMCLAPHRVLVVGDRTGLLAKVFGAGGAAVESHTADTIDLEKPLLERGYDLIAIIDALDTVNDLPGALLHLHAALAPGGVMIASVIGAGSLPRLRAALLAADGDRPAARMHPGIDAQSGAALLQRAGFHRQVADGWTLRLRYSALTTLIADLRAQGLNGVLADAPPPLTRMGLARANAKFLAGAEPDGKVCETLAIVTLTGWRQGPTAHDQARSEA